MINTIPTSNLVWVDLEMTDIDLKKGKIVEMATIITDSQLNVVEVGPRLVIHQDENIINNMSDWCKEHFKESGLTEEIRNSTTTASEAERVTLEFIKKHCALNTGLLAGSSVHVDKDFLMQEMPSIIDYLHYRIIDVSTVKELCLRWYPKTPVFPKVEPHRAQDDILESISELKYYREHIFK